MNILGWVMLSRHAGRCGPAYFFVREINELCTPAATRPIVIDRS
jgi:hypothetical protein